MRRAAVLVAITLATAGCGSASAPPKPRPDAGERVVRAWADAERAGRFDAANALFALPATVSNGGPALRFHVRAEIDLFNRSLPCGAILRRTQPAARGRLLATFELTERRGPGAACGSGVGHRAQVEFRIRRGRIVEWLRVDAPAAGGGGGGQLT